MSTEAEKKASQKFKIKMAFLGMKEIRGIFATDEEQAIIKPEVRKKLKKMRKKA